ncbi:hypothetical protein HK096_006355, partial [Nowakowskiella sp. JEL0078]
MLAERSKSVEATLAQAKALQKDSETLRESLQAAKEEVETLRRERDEANANAKELRLQVLAQRSNTAVEFEIQSLKKQLVESEKMNEKRQGDYQILLKSFATPNEDTKRELVRVRKLEAKWQRECQKLVLKLDMELSRSEELERKLQDETLKCKELKREVSDLRLVLHQTQIALNNEFSTRNMEKFANSQFRPSSRRDIVFDSEDKFDPFLETFQHLTQHSQPSSPTPKHSTYLVPGQQSAISQNIPLNSPPPRKSTPPQIPSIPLHISHARIPDPTHTLYVQPQSFSASIPLNLNEVTLPLTLVSEQPHVTNQAIPNFNSSVPQVQTLDIDQKDLEPWSPIPIQPRQAPQILEGEISQIQSITTIPQKLTVSSPLSSKASLVDHNESLAMRRQRRLDEEEAERARVMREKLELEKQDEVLPVQIASSPADEVLKLVDSVTEDPVLRKYMDIVRSNREKAKTGLFGAVSGVESKKNTVGEVRKSLFDNGSKDAHSAGTDNDFGAGDTEDDL